MTPILWSAIGMAMGAAILHTALGVHRPLDRTYLSFACMMLLVAVFLYWQWELYRASSVSVAVELKQHQVTVVNLFMACLFLFVPSYSNIRLPRSMTIALWVALGIAFVANVWLPYGLWFSGPPVLVPTTFLREPYMTVITPPMALPQLAYGIFLLGYMIVGVVCAAKMYRRGDRHRAVTFGIALMLIVVFGCVDVIRDNVGGSWPYIVEYGIVSWALVMCVQLARDFRNSTQTLRKAITRVDLQARQLTELLNALLLLEYDMKLPLYTLESGVIELARGTTPVDPQLRRIERAVTRLKDLSHLMPEIRLHR